MKLNNNNNNKVNKSLKKIEKDAYRDGRHFDDFSRDKLSSAGRKYLDAIVSARTAKPCGIPTLIGGEPGLTGKMKLRYSGTMETGTAGLGFISIGVPGYNGFYSDRIFGLWTDSTFAGTVLSDTSATIGVNTASFAESPYAAAGAVLSRDKVSYRLVGMEVNIQPIGSALNQDGKIAILEEPNHLSLNNLNFNQIATYKNARKVSGIKFSDQGNKITLNLHPRQNTTRTDVHFGPFQFAYHNTASGTALIDALGGTGGSCAAIAVSASAGLKYDFTVDAIYECRGFKVKNPSVTYTDGKDMDLVLNIFRNKRQSGWVGKPHEARMGYHGQLFKVIKEQVSGSNYGKKISSLWDDLKWTWGLVKGIAGF